MNITMYGNIWRDVVLSNESDHAFLMKMFSNRPKSLLIDLLINCGGGTPDKNFFDSESSDVFELMIAYILPLTSTKDKNSLQETIETYREIHKLPEQLIPFAYDFGEANLICFSLENENIYYWLHDEPDDRIRFVSNSIEEFLSGLIVSPL